MKVKIIEHIQSRKGDRLIVEIPAELSKKLVEAKQGEEIEITVCTTIDDSDWEDEILG